MVIALGEGKGLPFWVANGTAYRCVAVIDQGGGGGHELAHIRGVIAAIHPLGATQPALRMQTLLVHAFLSLNDAADAQKAGAVGLSSDFKSTGEDRPAAWTNRSPHSLLRAPAPAARFARRWIGRWPRRQAAQKEEIAIVSVDQGMQRLTEDLANARNDWVARIANNIVIAHAEPGGQLERDVKRWRDEGRDVSVLGQQ